MSSFTDPSTLRRSLSSAWLGLASPNPALATPPRGRRMLAGFGSVVVTPESWHLPGRHEHGRPLLRRAGETALARSWS